jgi:hypothetical protein
LLQPGFLLLALLLLFLITPFGWRLLEAIFTFNHHESALFGHYHPAKVRAWAAGRSIAGF